MLPRPASPTLVSQYWSNIGPTLNALSGVEITRFHEDILVKNNERAAEKNNHQIIIMLRRFSLLSTKNVRSLHAGAVAMSGRMAGKTVIVTGGESFVRLHPPPNPFFSFLLPFIFNPGCMARTHASTHTIQRNHCYFQAGMGLQRLPPL